MKNIILSLLSLLLLSSGCDIAKYGQRKSTPDYDPGKYQSPDVSNCKVFAPLHISWDSVNKSLQYNVKMGYTDKAFAELTEYTPRSLSHLIENAQRGIEYIVELNAITLAKKHISKKIALKLLTCEELRDLGRGDPITHPVKW